MCSVLSRGYCVDLIQGQKDPTRPGMSQSAADMSRNLISFNKARIHLDHVVRSVSPSSSPVKVSFAFEAYAKALLSIREPVEVEGRLMGINLRVEKKRKNATWELFLDMARKYKNGRTQFEIMTVIWWAKGDGDVPRYLLHNVGLASYAKELTELALSIEHMKDAAEKKGVTLKTMIRLKQDLAMKKAIVDTLEELDRDDTFRDKFEDYRRKSPHFNQMYRILFNSLYDEAPTIKQIIELAKKEL